ncbi:hypothetical protein E3U43_021916 [Larimichthys crocea]|uniref:Uncharacterized protein n=1 Tax=Larimichthys crocea TaxID=215358 RepID=A0ACD3R9W1_LARCR|nr:hypothetical protein E3U43_021916 [Larimichthys crocea]
MHNVCRMIKCASSMKFSFSVVVVVCNKARMNASAMKQKKITVISSKGCVSREKKQIVINLQFLPEPPKLSISLNLFPCTSPPVRGQLESMVVVWDCLGFSGQHSSSVVSVASCPLASLQLRAVGCAWGLEQGAAWELGCAGKGLQ